MIGFGRPRATGRPYQKVTAVEDESDVLVLSLEDELSVEPPVLPEDSVVPVLVPVKVVSVEVEVVSVVDDDGSTQPSRSAHACASPC